MLEQLAKEVIDHKGWERFLELGLPTKEWESFRHVRLSDLYARCFERAKRGNLTLTPQEGRLVFVNGCYAPLLSAPPKEIVVLPLTQAVKTYSGFLVPRLQKQLQEERDPFAALNRALYADALFLYLPPHSASRIDVHHYLTETTGLTVPRLHLFAGKGARGNLSYTSQAGGWVNNFIDFALDERAFLTLTTRVEKNPHAWHFEAVRATLKRGSVLKSYAFGGGLATSRQDYVVDLLEEESEASLNGICMVEEKAHHHIHVLMEHHAPHCRSHQHFKNVLKDFSRTSFEGKIKVHQKAQKTEAYQRNNNLILSPRASANSKPNLEIFADDVKASHGATVGQLDEEQLFYLQSRGISLFSAKEILVKAFCQEILDLHAHNCS